MALAQRRADTANLNILSLSFFIFRLTVLQLKFYFKCRFRLLNYISTGRTQQQIPLLRKCPSLAAINRNTMRIVVIILLLTKLTNSFGQTKQDTLKVFEVKAKTYLEQTYKKENFDSAAIQWNRVIFLDIQDIYFQKDKVLSDKIVVLNKLRNDYQTFYTLHKDFSLLHFDDQNISDESENPTIYFQYTFKEKLNGNDSTGSSYIYFIFDKDLSQWTIWDFRISEVLGDPKRWLK